MQAHSMEKPTPVAVVNHELSLTEVLKYFEERSSGCSCLRPKAGEVFLLQIDDGESEFQLTSYSLSKSGG